MERRDFLRIAFGVAAGTAAFASAAEAAPLAPHPLNQDAQLPTAGDARPAVTTDAEVARLKPEEVRWHHRHGGWHHRHWHRRWHHRHWGWHRRHWRRHWRHHHRHW
ncbi:twin-arginine translocation signal domain-containing protein [Bradyrhizobium genosp. L]|uniref:twin-arginine translocation signal domain-containing protein n=1 Tax=Bradyrhizobium genosp. L TaxID=83637 RepID=UPI0018A30F89|nr:twin-arginine translocation signal domain-containing protein [Bradyrhizobium genosp. L]QPF82376.1 twin-arginine translocation signal domain-containing protein [Bradyrhizobium genosp. L]